MCNATGKQKMADLELDPGMDELLSGTNELITGNQDLLTILNSITGQNNEILLKVFPNDGIQAVRTFYILEATVPAEFLALSDNHKDLYRIIISTSICDISSGTRVRQSLLDMFGPGTQTRANLIELFG